MQSIVKHNSCLWSLIYVMEYNYAYKQLRRRNRHCEDTAIRENSLELSCLIYYHIEHINNVRKVIVLKRFTVLRLHIHGIAVQLVCDWFYFNPNLWVFFLVINNLYYSFLQRSLSSLISRSFVKGYISPNWNVDRFEIYCDQAKEISIVLS